MTAIGPQYALGFESVLGSDLGCNPYVRGGGEGLWGYGGGYGDTLLNPLNLPKIKVLSTD